MARTYFHDFNRIDDEDMIVTVEYTMTTYIPATWDDPAEGGEVEIVKAWLTDSGTDIKLTEAEDEKFSQWLAENSDAGDDDGDDYDR